MEEKDLVQRITALENEVKQLRNEVQHLKQQTIPPVPMKKQLQPVEPKQQKLDTPVDVPPTIQQQQQPVKEKRSLEETLTRALPKIFMIILALGVLWGLKLVSDYGFLSDTIKMIGGFALSIALIIWAYVMEKKQKSRVVALSLYGGAFMIGILTTAAGAILYNVLTLYVALAIALLFILYGVWISYKKHNEALTVLVVFTSLLLPYLLEYMAFSANIIAIFVVLLFAGVQLVIIAHKQQKALAISVILSLLALVIVSTFHSEQGSFFAFAILLSYSVFLVSFLRISHAASKWNASLLFTVTTFVLVALNVFVLLEQSMRSIVLIILLGILAGASYFVWKQKQTLRFDLFATLAGLTLVNFIMQFNVSDDVKLSLILAVTASGLLLAFKHAIPFMKWVYSIVFTLLALFTFVFVDIETLFSLRHIMHLFILIALIVFYRTLRKSAHTKAIQHDVWPALIYVVALLYVWKLDAAFMPSHLSSYFIAFVIAISVLIVLALKPKIVGHLLPMLASVIYGMAGLMVFSDVMIHEQSIAVAIMLRVIYVGVLWALLVDLWNNGLIYKNYVTFFEKNTEKLTIGGILVSVFALFSFTNFLDYHELIHWNTAVIVNTVGIFFASCIALFLAAKRSDRSLKLTGIGLLFFGIVKMIFFDLSALDILIRSISFIVIGAIGLVISNKLLAKDKSTDD